MRRYLAFILILFVFIFTACTKQGNKTTENTTTISSTQESTTAPPTAEAADPWDPLSYKYIPEMNVIYERNEVNVESVPGVSILKMTDARSRAMSASQKPV